MANASLISRLSQAVDQIEKRLKQNRPMKVVTVRYCREEGRDAAKDRHFAAHPEDRDADIVVLIPGREEMADEGLGQHARNPEGREPSRSDGVPKRAVALY
jgi:hypothetical protein